MQHKATSGASLGSITTNQPLRAKGGKINWVLG